MTEHQRFTASAFTVALCTHCTAGPDRTVLAALRTTIRQCPHGVLVVTECLLGRFTCASRGFAAGPVVLLQPCDEDRSPRGWGVFVGPINAAADLQFTCEWIAHGDWDVDALPDHLRLRTHFAEQFIRRN